MLSAAAFLARNLCGVCTRMPAPSPARGSAPTAPRCSRLTRIVSASSTILCDLRPLMSAINPTPQESFSSVGSNKPKPATVIVHALLARPRDTRSSKVRRSRARTGSRHPAPGRVTHILEATCDPLNGRWLLVLAAVRRALATRQPIRASRRTSTDRALWDHNWDSNAVLCETWQIPGANTSYATQKGAREGAFS